MKVVVSKDQYRRLFLKYLESFVGDLEVIKNPGFNYDLVKTTDGEYIADIWFTGPISKGCKNELALEPTFTKEIENLIPLTRKKVFSEVMLEYFNLKTGIKCYCIEFEYSVGGSGNYGDPYIESYGFNLKKQ